MTRYLETGSQDPRYNLAFEELVLTGRTEGDYILLWQNQNTVVIGQNQIAEEEINRAFVERHKIQVVRRTTGGGAVYHDLGNLNYSFITDAGALETLSMARFTAPVIAALRSLGLDAEAGGRNDILVGGRKVSGTAQRVHKGRVLHHGTLLFDTDPEMIAGALNADPSKFHSKSAKSVRSRVGNIVDFLPEPMSLTDFWAFLIDALCRDGVEAAVLSREELQAVNALKAEKYDTWEWNFGKAPKYGLTVRRRWPGGLLESSVDVEQGHIAAAAFYGDFLSLRPLDGLCQALLGCPFRPDSVEAVLAQLPIRACFGDLSITQILDTMFDL